MLTNPFFYSLFFVTRFVLMYLMQGLPRLFPVDKYVNPAEVKQSQKDRESMWPLGLFMDTTLLGVLISYDFVTPFEGGFWPCFGILALVHVFIVEPIYYGYHRILHMGWIYRHHHIFHHRSIRTEATTSMSFTLIERISYTLLFSIPAFAVSLLGSFNYWAIFAFYLLFDFLNSLGHVNLKLEPKWYKKSPLKWLVYSPEYHEKHHSEFLANYALFMPIFDRLFGSVSKKSFEE